MKALYLSRRNLLSLLSKLDRKAKGESTACSIIKNDTEHEEFPAYAQVMVVAVEDTDYYKDRLPGEVLAVDDPDLKVAQMSQITCTS